MCVNEFATKKNNKPRIKLNHGIFTLLANVRSRTLHLLLPEIRTLKCQAVCIPLTVMFPFFVLILLSHLLLD